MFVQVDQDKDGKATEWQKEAAGVVKRRLAAAVVGAVVVVVAPW